jgi:hypothetical protein
MLHRLAHPAAGAPLWREGRVQPLLQYAEGLQGLGSGFGGVRRVAHSGNSSANLGDECLPAARLQVEGDRGRRESAAANGSHISPRRPPPLHS